MDSERLQPHEIDYVIYHHPCTDGTASMCVARHYMETHHPTKQVTYHGARINAPPPEDLRDKCVLICDYSYPKDVLLTLLGLVKKLLILDHHKTSEAALRDIDTKHKVFDMGKSGASLTWEYFHHRGDDSPSSEPGPVPALISDAKQRPSGETPLLIDGSQETLPSGEVPVPVPMPLLIQYVEDRDIWKNALPLSESFGIWWYSMPLTYESYKEYMLDDERLIRDIQLYGPICAQYAKSQIEALGESASIKFCRLRNGQHYFVVYINSSSFISDLGNYLINKYPLADFSAIFTIYESGTTKFSLRSTDTNADCSEIAKLYGGGGHRNASGCSSDVIGNVLPGRVYDDSTLFQRLNTIYAEERDGHNIVYIYTPQHKYAMCSYLLQTKYNNIQNADLILSQRITSKRYTVAIAYDYDALEDKTYFLMVTHRDIKNQDPVRELFGFNRDSKRQEPGLHKTLPIT
jgi:uncharacterized protein